MNLFTATDKNNFKGPHQNQKTVESGISASKADAAMIMVHGRGASAESIIDLAREFETDLKLTFRAPQASGFTWYPHSFLAPTKQNEPGLSSGLQKIFDIVSELTSKGIPTKKIYILGFSQGACLASEFVARHPAKYGGLIALSGGLIGDKINPTHYEGDLNETPVFLGCSDVDPHIPQVRVDETEAVLKQLGAKVVKKIYPGMGHTVNEDEIAHINIILNK